MRLSQKSTLGIVSGLSFYALAALAGEDDIRGSILVQNVDCPWYRGSLFAVQMVVNQTEGCYGYASWPKIVHEGESASWDLPFGTNGNCTYKVSGSVHHLPTVGRNQKAVFQMYYGECRATISNL